MKYQELYDRSMAAPELFWEKEAQNIAWFSAPKQSLSKDEDNLDRWFADGSLNTCYLALDYHLETGRGDQIALIYDSPVTGTKKTYTFRALTEKVAQFAGVLQGLGVSKGDTVVIYMPMIPETAIAMLACARLGAIHSVVFGGFAAHELAIRIDDARPKVLLTATAGIELTKIIPY
ncbi:MAG: AMP-binding protein, partial [Saprospiraceae bacterium]|nr:AMP-binding protein [Saprospiraceae bacterium]